MLLALTKLRPDDGAGLASTLESLGITADLVSRQRSTRHDGNQEVHAAAELKDLLIHTRWIAAYERGTEATPERLLLGVLWDSNSAASRLLREQGLAFDVVYRELRATTPPPELTPASSPAVDVELKDFDRVIARLPQLLPPTASFAFNMNEERAWFWSDEEVDLAPYVRRALAQGPSQGESAPG